MNMRGNLTVKILQTLKEMSFEGADLCEAILVAGYGASGSKVRKLAEDLRERRSVKNALFTEKRYRRNYQKLVSKLKAQGLLKVEDRGGQDFFSITSAGRTKLAVLESEANRRMPEVSYELVSSLHPIIVSFDIPEKQKRKREWLREALKRLGLKMVQKSVWIGLGRVPKQFLEDLEKLNLLECIEIFEVSKTGTLRHVA